MTNEPDDDVATDEATDETPPPQNGKRDVLLTLDEPSLDRPHS